MKTPVLSLKECYAILGLPQGASLDDIKRAYRKRAFELHPDLNPSDGASRQFQKLNEAYVILIRLMDTASATTKSTSSSAEASATSAKAGRTAYRDQARQERAQDEQDRKERKVRQEAERREREELNRQAREQRERQEKEQRETERRERLRREIERQEADRLARQQRDRMEKERRAETRKQAEQEHEEKLREQAATAEAHRRSYARPQAPGSSAGSDAPGPEHAGSTATGGVAGAPGATASSATGRNTVPPSGPPSSAGTSTSASQAAGAYSSTDDREGMLNDLLHDPFARRVYEDIYREVQSRKEGPVITPGPALSPPDEDVPLQPAEIAKNMGKAVKGWLQGQIDEEQEMFFPASKLFPGARIRLQIRRGFPGELKTVDITLPPDFAVGKVVRLKGMGKKIGRWQGDLYLTFQIK